MAASTLPDIPQKDGDGRKSYTQLQRLAIPFQAPNRGPCSAVIEVSPTEDPYQDGHHLLGVYYPAEVVAKGFPRIEGKVSSPVSRGYAAMYGWIQLFAAQLDGPLPSDLALAPWKVDPISITADLATPFVWFGQEPTLFDGPSRVEDEECDWLCRSFLCYLDHAVSSRTPKPILVVEWGYYWLKGHKPVVKKLEQVEVRVWNQHLELLRGQFPSWQFDDV